MSDEIKKDEQQLEMKNKKKRKSLLILLFVFALITTVTVSLLLQNNTSKLPSIDTIPIDPISTRDIHLSGQISYEDGTPYQNGNVELHSDVQNTTTDKKGWFLFENVKAEEHTLYVLDDKGKELAKAEINLKQNKDNTTIDITKKKDGNYVVNISTDIRYLELSVKISEDNLLLIDETTYAITDNGTIVNVNGVLTTENGAIILESGTVITEGNHIIHLPYAIDQNNKVTEIDKNGGTLSDGTTINKDGSITLPSGSIVDIDKGTVTPPKDNDGNNDTDQEIPKDTPSQVEPDGTVKPVQPSKPAQPDTPEEPADPDKPTEPEDPTDPETPDLPEGSGKDDGAVYSKKDVGWSTPWTAKTDIDLFGKENAIIQPGSKGTYIFLVQNNRTSDLNVAIEIAEGQTHLPLTFRFGTLKTPSDSLSKDVKKQSWNSNKTLTLTTGDSLSGKDSSKNYTIYCLEWEWPFESGDDAYDTSIGKKSPEYKLDMKIKLEEK